jgi:hypothetical protein
MTIGAPGSTVTTTVPGQNANFTFRDAGSARAQHDRRDDPDSRQEPRQQRPHGPQAFATAPTFIDPIMLTQTGVHARARSEEQGQAERTLTGRHVPADTWY